MSSKQGNLVVQGTNLKEAKNTCQTSPYACFFQSKLTTKEVAMLVWLPTRMVQKSKYHTVVKSF